MVRLFQGLLGLFGFFGLLGFLVLALVAFARPDTVISMETYAYLLLAVWLLAVWLLIARLRPDLQSTMLRASIVGSALGPLSELWYFRDYWRPATLLGTGVLSLEDVLFGFGIAGIAVAVADVMLRSRSTARTASRSRLIFLCLLCLLVGGVLLSLGTSVFGFNSIVVSSAIFLGLAVAMLVLRPDLLLHSLVSGAACLACIIPIYFLLSRLAPTFVEAYWLVAMHPVYGIRILPGLPLSEVLWYVSWGVFAGIVIPWAEGSRKVPVPRHG